MKSENFYKEILLSKDISKEAKDEARRRYAGILEVKNAIPSDIGLPENVSSTAFGYVSTFDSDDTLLETREMNTEEIAKYCDGNCDNCSCDEKPYDDDNDDDTFLKDN